MKWKWKCISIFFSLGISDLIPYQIVERADVCYFWISNSNWLTESIKHQSIAWRGFKEDVKWAIIYTMCVASRSSISPQCVLLLLVVLFASVGNSIVLSLAFSLFPSTRNETWPFQLFKHWFANSSEENVYWRPTNDWQKMEKCRFFISKPISGDE